MQHEVENAADRIRENIDAIEVLERNPASPDNIEFIIGRRSGGYVALYRYIEQLDTVFVLAIEASARQAMTGSIERLWRDEHLLRA